MLKRLEMADKYARRISNENEEMSVACGTTEYSECIGIQSNSIREDNTKIIHNIGVILLLIVEKQTMWRSSPYRSGAARQI